MLSFEGKYWGFFTKIRVFPICSKIKKLPQLCVLGQNRVFSEEEKKRICFEFELWLKCWEKSRPSTCIIKGLKAGSFFLTLAAEKTKT